MKKILTLMLALVMTLSLVTVAWGAGVACGNGCTDATHIAAVGSNHYTDLQEAIKDAAPSGTVEILKDVTVAEWKMFAENMTSGSGVPIQLNINGLTINGNGHELTVNSISSASNGNRLFYDAENLNIYDLTITVADGVAGGIGLKSGVIDGVTFNKGCGIFPGNGNVKINDCVFNTTSHVIYYEEARDNLVVTNNEFNPAAGANVIILRGSETFTGNTVNSGRTVNIVSDTADVSGNTFNTRVKMYKDGTTLSGNSFKDDAYIALNDDPTSGPVVSDPASINLSGNYWGGGAPSDTQIPTAANGVKIDTYATTVAADGTVGNLYNSNGTPVTPPVYYPTYTPVVEDTTVDSPKTFDAGIALYVGVSVAAAMGTVTLSKKRED